MTGGQIFCWTAVALIGVPMFVKLLIAAYTDPWIVVATAATIGGTILLVGCAPPIYERFINWRMRVAQDKRRHEA